MFGICELKLSIVFVAVGQLVAVAGSVAEQAAAVSELPGCWDIPESPLNSLFGAEWSALASESLVVSHCRN